MTALLSERACLDVECGHEHSAEGGPDLVEGWHCDEVTEQAVCVTHSAITADGTVTRAVPWPCQHTKETTR